MTRKLLLVLIILAWTANAQAQDNSSTKLDSNAIKNQTGKQVQSNKLSVEEFTYANQRRFLVDGSTAFRDTEIQAIPAIAFGGTIVTFLTIQHIAQLNTIWQEQGEWTKKEDGNYAFGADKLGHIFGTYFTSYMMTEGLMVSGLDWETATVVGTILGLGYSTYVEVMDGYGAKWGFSPSDFYADIGGATFHVLQFYIPYLQNFTPKFSYFPAPWFGENHRVGSDAFIDDYSSHSIFINANVYNMMPDSWQSYWVPWIDLSFGYAARNLCDNPANPCDPTKSVECDGPYCGSPRYIVGLDFNIVKLLPDGPGFWNWFKQTANHFKFPAPAIEFGPTTKFHLLYPFKIEFSIKM
jgi:predicted lipoprotein DUF2279